MWAKASDSAVAKVTETPHHDRSQSCIVVQETQTAGVSGDTITRDLPNTNNTGERRSDHCPLCNANFRDQSQLWCHINLEHIPRRIIPPVEFLVAHGRRLCSEPFCSFAYADRYRSCQRSLGRGNQRCSGFLINPAMVIASRGFPAQNNASDIRAQNSFGEPGTNDRPSVETPSEGSSPPGVQNRVSIFTRCSLRTLSFYLIRHKNDHIVRFRCKPILSLLHHLPHFALPGRFGQSLNLLNRDLMASGGSGIKKEGGGGFFSSTTRMQNTCTKGTD